MRVASFKESVLISIVIYVATISVGQTANGPASRPGDDPVLTHRTMVKQKVDSLIQATLREGEFTRADGLKVTTRVPPSEERIEQVKQLGASAVPALTTYISSQSPREQELAMRFLAAFGGEQIVEPLHRFAKQSPFPVNRAEAIQFLTQAPLSSALPIIEDVSKTDADAYVRKTASEILAKYANEK